MLKKISLIQTKYLINSYADTVCWISSQTVVTCKNENSSVNFQTSITSPNLFSGSLSTLTLTDPQIVSNNLSAARGVAFRDLYGTVYYQSFNSSTITTFSSSASSIAQAINSFSAILTNDFFVGADLSLVANVLDTYQGTVTSTLTGLPTVFADVPFLYLGESVSDFSWGRNALYTWSCIVRDYAPTVCSFSDAPFILFPPSSFTTLQSITAITLPPTLDLTSGLYITQEVVGATQYNGVVKFFGLPACYTGSFSGSCSFLSPPLIENIPTASVLNSVTQVAIGNWGACAVSGQSLTCWGAFPTTFPQSSTLWTSFQSVSHVSIYNKGGCVEYVSQSSRQAQCWGSLDSVVSTLYLDPYLPGTGLAPLQMCSPYDQVYNNICYPCAPGFSLETSPTSEFLTCLSCQSISSPLPSARGINDLNCVLCGLGSQSSDTLAECVPCATSFFRTLVNGVSMSSCQECSAGSISSADRQSCVPCPTLSARGLGSLTCSVCPLGTLPVADQSRCLGCPPPQRLLTTTQPPVCAACPIGQHAVDGFCVTCPPPTFRTSEMTDCAPCPPGFFPLLDGTSCTQCPPSTIRKNTSVCSPCPTGLLASTDSTQCINPHPPSLDPILSLGKTLAIGTGLLVICACSLLISLKKLTPNQGTVGIFLGFAIMCGAFLV